MFSTGIRVRCVSHLPGAGSHDGTLARSTLVRGENPRKCGNDGQVEGCRRNPVAHLQLQRLSRLICPLETKKMGIEFPPSWTWVPPSVVAGIPSGAAVH